MFQRMILICFLVVLAASGILAQSIRDDGVAAYREGKFEKAIELLEQSVATDKKDKIAWRYLGASYVHIGQMGKAQNAFSKSQGTYKGSALTYDIPFKIFSKPQARPGNAEPSSGSIEVVIELRADGTIGFVFPFASFTGDYEKNVINAAKGIRFEPAIKSGKPVPVLVVFVYSYSR